jgi:hypothetical protein
MELKEWHWQPSSWWSKLSFWWKCYETKGMVSTVVHHLRRLSACFHIILCNIDTIRYESLRFDNICHLILQKWRQEAHLKHYQISNRLRGVTSQKAIFFVITASWEPQIPLGWNIFS